MGFSHYRIQTLSIHLEKKSSDFTFQPFNLLIMEKHYLSMSEPDPNDLYQSPHFPRSKSVVKTNDSRVDEVQF